jgi:integrase
MDEMDQSVSVWEDLGPTPSFSYTALPSQPSAEIMRIVTELGLRYPPANSVDREAHAARVALLAKDCADLNPFHLQAACDEWARGKPFLPRACELREAALAWGRITRPDRILAAPKPRPAPKPVPPPLTDDEIKRLPQHLVDLGISVGEIDPERAQRLRAA